MSSHYAITFGLSGPSQPELIQALRSLGAESIQTGKGLCVKTELTRDDLEKELARHNFTGMEISALSGDLAPDVAAFVKKV